MSTKSVTVSCLAVALFAVALRDAVALSYTVSGGSVLANQGDGLIVNTSLSLPATPFTFNLIDGQSETFSFFKIWTDETTVNSDDEVEKSISATLYFSDPLTQATVGGVTLGGSILWGLSQWGQVVWNSPPTFTAPDNRIFQVALSDEIFNEGHFGLDESQRYGAIVTATVKQIGSTSVSVPDNGATAMLLGLSLLAISVFRKRQAVV